jgi:hypothetical protein
MALAELDSGGRRWLLAGFPPDRAATDWPARQMFGDPFEAQDPFRSDPRGQPHLQFIPFARAR